MGLKIGGRVEKVNGRAVSYGEFSEKYMAQNQPVVLSGLMDDWRACKDWVSPNGKPNLHFFSTHFGKSKVQVADCGAREFTDQKRIEMTVSEFVDHWLRLSSADNGGNSDSGAAARSLLYLKDWHFVKEHGHLFMLMYSGHTVGLQMNMKSSVYNIFAEVSLSKFPGFEKAIWLECTQEENEVIFVPSGWYHQVHNMEDTISINHNWFNGYNLSWVWDLLLKDYSEASDYIEDLKGCDDFEELCQRNLAANTGMNFYDFFIFIVRFAFANVVLLDKLAHGKKEPNRKSSKMIQHIYFNIGSIRSVAVKMKPIDADDRQGVLLDLRRNLEDHSFIELCAAVGKAYELIHDRNEVTQALSQCKDLTFSSLIGFQVQSSEDLVTFIDDALTKLGGAFSG